MSAVAAPAKAVDAKTAAMIKDILGKGPGGPKLEDHYQLDKQLGKGSFGVVHLVS